MLSGRAFETLQLLQVLLPYRCGMVRSVSGVKAYAGILAYGIMGPGLPTGAYSEYGVGASCDFEG